MLKDLFKKKNKDLKETIAKSLMDGYVDIKAYKYDKDGNKTMVYHDTGDNTITDWMRHAIMLMLSGYSLSFNGNNVIDGNESAKDKEQISKPNLDYHSSSENKGYNKDGYCFIGEQ